MTNSNNLYIRFKVVLPSKLSEERKMYIKKLIQTKSSSVMQFLLQDSETKEIKFLDELDNEELENVKNNINILNIKSNTNGHNQSNQFES